MPISSTIKIDVELDDNKIPDKIFWSASASSAEQAEAAKAMLLALWDGADKAALRIDLWTKDMMVDEMGDFFYQTLMGMADTFDKATHNHELVEEMKSFAKNFYQKFRANQLKENKAS
ncbi:MAG: gliding motility protein GldC [Bacteroidetes bacterium]|nr:gliding motility protein GldC [Bacteroidota bacterium]MBS1649190.1 gliding motility protein GldC [Bacteroidota bacterium]